MVGEQVLFVATLKKSLNVGNTAKIVENATQGTIKAGFKVGSKAEALQSLKNLPDDVAANVKRFFKKSGSEYTEYAVDILENGNYRVKMTKPGNVSGYAEYYKVIDPKGNTIETFKDTFDNLGNLIHRKYK